MRAFRERFFCGERTGAASVISLTPDGGGGGDVVRVSREASERRIP